MSSAKILVHLSLRQRTAKLIYLFITTFISVLMFVAYAASTLELPVEIGNYHILGFALGPYDDFDVVLVEDFNSSTTHATADDDIHSHIMEEVRQEARLVPGVSNGSFTENLTLIGFEDLKALTMAKVA